MKITKLFSIFTCTFLFGISAIKAQAPVANFSINPNPVCSGAGNVVQITDLSTGTPTSWTYTVSGFGPMGTTLTAQNPTLSFNAAGVFSITLIATNASGASTPVTHTIQVLPSPNAQVNPQNQNTCIGGAINTLSVLLPGPGNGGMTYSWSTGATTQTLSVSPTVTTVYSCVITSTNGCSVTRSSTVNISTPTVNVTSNPFMLCPGSIATLTAVGQQPGPFTYTWNLGATTRTIVTNTTGVYNVTVTNGNGCVGVQSYSLGSSTTLSMNATSTPTTLCAGNTATLRADGASSYTWSTGGTTPNTTVNPGSSATYTVMGQLGTCTGSATISLQVSNLPTLSIVSTPTSLCTGSSATLMASGATTYTWLPNTASQSIVVTPMASTTYTVRGTNPGCPARGATVNIAVQPSPTVSIVSSATIVCAGENVALAASGAPTYSWSTGASAGVIIVNPLVTTTYSVTGTSSSGCSSTAALTQTVSDCSGISEAQYSEMSTVYPNPSNGDFKIITTTNAKLIISDVNGKVLSDVQLDGNNERTFDGVNYFPGVYYLIFRTDQSVSSQKLIITK